MITDSLIAEELFRLTMDLGPTQNRSKRSKGATGPEVVVTSTSSVPHGRKRLAVSLKDYEQISRRTTEAGRKFTNESAREGEKTYLFGNVTRRRGRCSLTVSNQNSLVVVQRKKTDIVKKKSGECSSLAVQGAPRRRG